MPTDMTVFLAIVIQDLVVDLLVCRQISIELTHVV